MKPALEETQSNREDFLGHRVCLVLDGLGSPAGFGFGQVFRNCEIAPRKPGGISQKGLCRLRFRRVFAMSARGYPSIRSRGQKRQEVKNG